MTEFPFKKREMEQFYQSCDNPWGYGAKNDDKHSEVYKYVFGEIEKELP